MPVPDNDHIRVLSQLVLDSTSAAEAPATISQYGKGDRERILRIADSHHVTIRALSVLHEAARRAGEEEIVRWSLAPIERENSRIGTALSYLNGIVHELEANGCPVVVMKSLDHWPDIGTDLDLYTTAHENRVVDIFTNRLRAKIEPRSWGDRLAQKWNFKVPDLPELVEIHIQRLGQTGEHTAMAYRLVGRRVHRELMGFDFPVPAPEERVIVATLQRMYRHFYFRICDIVNSSALVEQNQLDYRELEKAANLGGIWPGVCTYLKIVSDYVTDYRGEGLCMPAQIFEGAVCGGEQVHPKNLFLRVPIVPHGATLYTKQVTTTALHGHMAAALRLSLLPPLASVAALAQRVTGSDKGIW